MRRDEAGRDKPGQGEKPRHGQTRARLSKPHEPSRICVFDASASRTAHRAASILQPASASRIRIKRDKLGGGQRYCRKMHSLTPAFAMPRLFAAVLQHCTDVYTLTPWHSIVPISGEPLPRHNFQIGSCDLLLPCVYLYSHESYHKPQMAQCRASCMQFHKRRRAIQLPEQCIHRE